MKWERKEKAGSVEIWEVKTRLLTPKKSEGLLPWPVSEEGLYSVLHLCKGLSPDLDLWNIIALKVINACSEVILSQLGLCSWASRLM